MNGLHLNFQILKYSRDTLVAHNSHVAALSSGLPESISKEMTSFVSLSLHRLQFADFDRLMLFYIVIHYFHLHTFSSFRIY